ncbi:hypothetical protein [Actinokineospora terrae]|uniref:Uncharacterized protein n=1 Tax=Actinokineospora terrae TaxID=155974 RepID=A0A1H9UUF6_9PSEU|nr:hypothetical protein [Actinokineospora terrae]SES12697.1 hypothetical protein SAMN04487818_107467 [Actinokineospora terrae]
MSAVECARNVPKVAPVGGNQFVLSRLPQTTAEVRARATELGQGWPAFVPTLVSDLDDLINYAREVKESFAKETFGEGSAIDNLDSTAYGVIEACRWLQVFQFRDRD